MEMRLHKQTSHTKDVVKNKKDGLVHVRVDKATVIMASERTKMKNIMKEPCRYLVQIISLNENESFF